MKVSTRGDYAARALLSLALRGDDQPTAVKEIAGRTGLPQPYLEQILLAVKGAGLVVSKRGVGGGYVLARPADQITLAEILCAVDATAPPFLEEPDSTEGHWVLQEAWYRIGAVMQTELGKETLADLASKARTAWDVLPGDPGSPEAAKASRS